MVFLFLLLFQQCTSDEYYAEFFCRIAFQTINGYLILEVTP